MKVGFINFTALMVRALLENRKSQTRRIVSEQSWWCNGEQPVPLNLSDGSTVIDTGYGQVKCRYGQPGDLLYVKEAWSVPAMFDGAKGSDTTVFHPGAARGIVRYIADGKRSGRYRHSRFMPRWASRLTLELTDVRVQRVRDISTEDAIAEGTACWICGGRVDGQSENDCACFHSKETAKPSYWALWDSINGAGSYELSPLVWALTFNVHKAHVDRVQNDLLSVERGFYEHAGPAP